MAYNDNTSPSFYNASESGTVAGYVPPFTSFLHSFDTLYSEGAYHLPLDIYRNNETPLLKLFSSVTLTQFRITCDINSPDVLLVNVSGAHLGLYSNIYGDIHRTSVTNIGGGKFVIDWGFSAFDIAYFVVGIGGAGYPSSRPGIIYKIETDAVFLSSTFWTNFIGQSERV